MPMSLFQLPELAPDEQAVYSLLRTGRDNAISVKDITAETGMSDVAVRQIVRHLIMEHGILIGSSVSDPPGYYIPESIDEAVAATRSLRHGGIMILMRAARLQKSSVRLVFGQGLFEIEESDGKADGQQP